MANNRRLFRAAQNGDFETLAETIKKYDDTLDINYKYPKDLGKTADGSEKSKLEGLTAIHIAAANGNLRCLRELLNFGLYKYDKNQHDVPWRDQKGKEIDDEVDVLWTPVPNPLQLAWENGCAQAVKLLSDIGFVLDFPDSGKEVLRERLVESLVQAGKHPERGSKDLVWILGTGIEETVELGEGEKKEALDVDNAVESTMAALVMRHEWEGLAQFMFATQCEKLELWESWVNMSVIRAVSGSCGGLLKMFHVENGTFMTSNLVTISEGIAPFGTLAMIFHGALEADEKERDSGHPGSLNKEKSMRELMQHVAHSTTSFYIAGTSRFMKHALPQSYKYTSQPFLTDHSANPTQWMMTLNTRGTTYLDVFLTYQKRLGMERKRHEPKHVIVSMIITCKYVTLEDKINVSRPIQVDARSFERDRETVVANFDVSKCQPGSGKELIEIRLSEVFIMDPIKERKCRERLGTRIAEWRLCGLPHILPTGIGSSPELWIESNSMVTGEHNTTKSDPLFGYGTLQLSLHVGAIDQEPVVESQKATIDDEWFHERIQLLVGSDSAPVKGDSKADNQARKQWKKVAKKMADGEVSKLQTKQGEIELNADGRVNSLADVEISIMSPMVEEALEMFEKDKALRQLTFTENLSSKARKFVHQESKRCGLQSRSRTDKKTGKRKLIVGRIFAGVENDYPVNVFVGNAGSEPLARQSFALRIEEEDGEADTGRTERTILNHRYLTDVSLDSDNTHTFGCYNMAVKSDFENADFPGSLVTIVRYQYDETNHPHAKKEEPGQALLVGTQDESNLTMQFKELLEMPPNLIPHGFELPDRTAEDLVSFGRFLTKKKGEKLTVAGEHFGEIVFIVEGLAESPIDKDDGRKQRQTWAHNSAIGNLRDFLYGCGVNHEHTAVAKSECRVFVVRRSALIDGTGPAPRAFSPASFQSLFPEVELEARTTTVRWVLHGAPELLSGRSQLVSDYFDVTQTEYNQCSWRLHIVPRDRLNKRIATFPMHAKSASDKWAGQVVQPVYVGVFVSCAMHDSLSTKQLEKGSFSLSAQNDGGTIGLHTASLADGYPGKLEVLGDHPLLPPENELGWGFSLSETWASLVEQDRWEIECKLSIGPKYSTGFGVAALVEESKWAVENSIALAQASIAEAGNLVGGIVIGGDAGKLGDRMAEAMPGIPGGGKKKLKRGKSKKELKRTKSKKDAAAKQKKNGRETREVGPITPLRRSSHRIEVYCCHRCAFATHYLRQCLASFDVCRLSLIRWKIR